MTALWWGGVEKTKDFAELTCPTPLLYGPHCHCSQEEDLCPSKCRRLPLRFKSVNKSIFISRIRRQGKATFLGFTLSTLVTYALMQQTSKCKNYLLTERTHVPRRLCFDPLLNLWSPCARWRFWEECWGFWGRWPPFQSPEQLEGAPPHSAVLRRAI